MLDVSVNAEPSDGTVALALKRNVYQGICMYLEEKGLAKLLTVRDDPEAVPQRAVPRGKINEETFNGFVSQNTIRTKIMPIVALKVAEGYGIPLWSRGHQVKEYYTDPKYGMSDEHYDLLKMYMPYEEVERIRKNMGDSYNNSSHVQKNPHLSTDIDTIGVSVVKIEAPAHQQASVVEENFSSLL